MKQILRNGKSIKYAVETAVALTLTDLNSMTDDAYTLINGFTFKNGYIYFANNGDSVYAMQVFEMGVDDVVAIPTTHCEGDETNEIVWESSKGNEYNAISVGLDF